MRVVRFSLAPADIDYLITGSHQAWNQVSAYMPRAPNHYDSHGWYSFWLIVHFRTRSKRRMVLCQARGKVSQQAKADRLDQHHIRLPAGLFGQTRIRSGHNYPDVV